MEMSQEQVADQLSQPQTLDYDGRTGTSQADGLNDVQYDNDIDRMGRHPVVAEAIRVQEAGISTAKFRLTKASCSEVGAWALKSLTRFWENDLYKVQRSYRRGWIGGEILYREQGGMLDQVGLKTFHYRHARPLLFEKRQYAGIRVRNLRDQGQALLRAAGRWPGRAFWHGHDLMHERFFGEGLFLNAHRDWQRLATQRGTEEILDLSITRTAVAGPEFRYDSASVPKRLNGTLDYEANRQKARQIIEDWVAGMSLLLSSDRDEKGNYKWDAKWPQTVLNTDPLLNVIKHYESRICYGIGTPRELMESTETGGWSGRNISMETFLTCQQRYARQILTSWYEQIGEPLCRFHYGPEAFFALELIPLNETRAAQMGTDATQGGGQPGQPGQQPIGRAPQPSTAYGLPSQQDAAPRRLMNSPPTSRRIKTSQLWLESYVEGQHPRSNDGKWTSKGGGEKPQRRPISEKTAKRLKPQPEGWGAPIIPGHTPRAVWNSGTSGGYERAKGLIDEARQLYAKPDKVTLDQVKAFAQKILTTTGRDALYTLAIATGVKTGTSKAIAERVAGGLAPGQDLGLQQVDQTKEQQLLRQIRDAGGSAQDAKNVAAYSRQLRDEENKGIDYRNGAVQFALEILASHNGGKPITKKHKAFDGGDYNDLSGFDVMTREVNLHYPGVIADGEDQEGLFQLLTEGVQPRVTILDTFPRAYEEWERAGAGKSKSEEVPF